MTDAPALPTADHTHVSDKDRARFIARQCGITLKHAREILAKCNGDVGYAIFYIGFMR